MAGKFKASENYKAGLQLKTGIYSELLSLLPAQRVMRSPLNDIYISLLTVKDRTDDFTENTFVKNNSNWVRWDIRKKISNKDNEYRVYDEDEVDIFAFVCLFIDKVVFVPNKNVGKTYQKKVEFISEIQTLETLVSSAQVVRDLKL